MLDPVLNKQWIQKGKSKYINLMDKLCEFQETFALYLITRLPNPHFSPEDQAKCVVVDFTVTARDGGAVARSGDPEGTKELGGAIIIRLNDVATNTKAFEVESCYLNGYQPMGKSVGRRGVDRRLSGDENQSRRS